jgi:hypothetical protein
MEQIPALMVFFSSWTWFQYADLRLAHIFLLPAGMSLLKAIEGCWRFMRMVVYRQISTNTSDSIVSMLSE